MGKATKKKKMLAHWIRLCYILLITAAADNRISCDRKHTENRVTARPKEQHSQALQGSSKTACGSHSGDIRFSEAEGARGVATPNLSGKRTEFFSRAEGFCRVEVLFLTGVSLAGIPVFYVSGGGERKWMDFIVL